MCHHELQDVPSKSFQMPWMGDNITQQHHKYYYNNRSKNNLIIIKHKRSNQQQQIQKYLEKQMGFSYGAAIGEFIYAIIACRPDISFAVTKLSQYSIKPVTCHYVADKNIFGTSSQPLVTGSHTGEKQLMMNYQMVQNANHPAT